MEYRFAHFKRELIGEDADFAGGIGPGQALPDFQLPTVDGGWVHRSDFVDTRPLFLTFGSITCPMTASAGPMLKRLYQEFGDRIAFLTVYVREAHPGERYPQPRTFEEKLAHARDYQARDHLPWPVAVDDLDGTFHRALDGKPNAAYLVDQLGNVVSRILWSNDKRGIRRTLRALAEGRETREPVRAARLIPMLRGLGKMHETFQVAGPGAERDVRREVPPLFALERLAYVFRPLPPLGRSLAAVATSTAVVAGAIGGTWRLVRR